MNNIEILEEFIDKVDIYFNDDIGDCAITSKIAGIIKNLIKENKELKENQIWSEATIEGLKKDFVPVTKLKEIIYPTPENPIPLEIQSNEMYKKLEKLVEGE